MESPQAATSLSLLLPGTVDQNPAVAAATSLSLLLPGTLDQNPVATAANGGEIVIYNHGILRNNPKEERQKRLKPYAATPASPATGGGVAHQDPCYESCSPFTPSPVHGCSKQTLASGGAGIQYPAGKQIRPPNPSSKQGLRVFLVFLVLLFLSGQGYACDLSSIDVKVAKTGRVVKGWPEFKVVIDNTCKCYQDQLILSCDGFTSYEPLNAEVLRKVDSGCLVNDGRSIGGSGFGGDPFRFQYAGTLPTKKFAPVSANIAYS